jgi:hypothetical protein
MVPTAHGQNVTASAVGQYADLGLLGVGVGGLLLAGGSDFWRCNREYRYSASVYNSFYVNGPER